MQILLFVLVVLVLLVSPSMANECETLIRQIDDAAVAYDQEVDFNLAEVKQHRTAGEIAHYAGDHATAVAELQKALTLMGLNT